MSESKRVYIGGDVRFALSVVKSDFAPDNWYGYDEGYIEVEDDTGAVWLAACETEQEIDAAADLMRQHGVTVASVKFGAAPDTVVSEFKIHA